MTSTPNTPQVSDDVERRAEEIWMNSSPVTEGRNSSEEWKRCLEQARREVRKGVAQ